MIKKYEFDSSINAILEQVMSDFPDRFDFPIEDIEVVKTSLPNSAAKIRKIPKLYQFLTGKELCIEIDDEIWQKVSYDKKYVIIANELNRVSVTDKREYKLLKPDVEAFSLFIDLFGKHYEHVEGAREKLKEAWRKKS